MSNVEHTPTPWRFGKGGPVTHSYSQDDIIYAAEGANLIAGCFFDVKGGPEVAAANAEFIARACNHHDEMYKKLQQIYSEQLRGSDLYLELFDLLKRAGKQPYRC